MEAEQKIDFSAPRRQSRIAIGIILVKFLRLNLKIAWPLFLSFLIGGRYNSAFENTMGYVAIAFGAINLIGSVLTYFRFYFHLEENAMVIDKGLLRRTHTNVPFERIQTINFRQNLLHQIFNVVSVEVDTAGAAKSEISIDALTKSEANALRDQIMSGKKQIATQGELSTVENAEPAGIEEEKEELILHLSPKDLLKVGVSQNHLRSMGLIFLFVFSTIGQVTNNWEERMTNQVNQYQGYAPDGGFLIFAIIISVLVISFLFSLINTVLKHYELSFFMKSSGFKLVRGLFNREEIAINKSKIQTISCSETLVRHLLGLWTLQIEQAGSREMKQSKIKVPGCYTEQVNRVIKTTFPAAYYREEPRFRVSILLKYRLFVFIGVIPFLLVGLALWTTLGWEVLYLLFWLPIVGGIVHLYHSKRSFELNEELLKNNAGIFGRKHELTQIYKVQAVKIKQSWYQRKKSLATVQLFTAAGRSAIPFIPLSLALELENYLLYRAESDKREWM